MTEHNEIIHFDQESMSHILRVLQKARARCTASDTLVFEILDPDQMHCSQPEGGICQGDKKRAYFSYKNWMDLAEILGCRFLTPQRVSAERVRIRLKSLKKEGQHLQNKGVPITEKYGIGSEFWRQRKFEEPTLIHDLNRCLAHCGWQEFNSILELGCNHGDFLAFALEQASILSLGKMSYTGIDYAASAIAHAGNRFPKKQEHHFIEGDINRLPELSPGIFDLVIGLGIFQSPSIDRQKVMRELVQNHLAERSGIIIGLPNCRYRDGEIIYGAQTKNFKERELSLLIKDAAFIKKYLQQHRFRVMITGKYDLLIAGVRKS